MAVDPQIRALARRIAALEKQALQRKQPTLGNSSIEGGALQAADDNGDLTMIMGTQFDGTNTAAVVTGPTPPQPLQPLVSSAPGGLRIYWDGTFTNGDVAPMDFARVLAYAVPSASYTGPDPLNQAIVVGEFTTALGGEITAGLDDAEYVVYLATWTQAGKFGPASDVSIASPATVLPSIPTEPPAGSPTPTVLAGPAAAVVTWVRDTDSRTRYDVYAATSDTAPLDSSTLVAEGVTGPSLWLDSFADGTPIPADVDSWFAIVATNLAGDAAPSPWTAGRAGTIEPEFLQLNVDLLLANDVFTRALTAAGASIGGGTWNSEVFELPGALMVDLATAVATFYGDVVATELTAEYLKVRGAQNWIEGVLNLAAGIAPPNQPRVSRGSHPFIQMYFGGDDFGADSNAGLAQSPSGKWLSAINAPYFYSTATYASDAGLESTQAMPGGFAPYGITALGTDYFVIGTDDTRSSDWYIYKFNSSWTKTAELLLATTTGLSCTLGNDGTNLVAVIRNAAGDLIRYVRNTSLAAVGSSLALDDWPGATLTGTHVNTSRSRVYVASNTEIRAYNSTTGARVAVDDLPRATGETIKGFCLGADGLYRSLAASGRIYTHSDQDTTRDLTVTVTALDSAGAVQTTPSATRPYTQRPGTYLKLDADPLNDDGDPLKPKRIQFYVSGLTSTRHGQGVLAAGTWAQTVDVPNEGGPTEPGTNGFDSLNVTPGSLRSAETNGVGKPHIDLSGSGEARIVKHSQFGNATINFAGTATATVAVTFDTPFDAAPSINHNAVGASSYFPYVVSKTATGAVLGLRHWQGTATTAVIAIDWQAGAIT